MQVYARIDSDGTVWMMNRTGHAENFFVSGVTPEVYVTLDGNRTYNVVLQPTSPSAPVEVRWNGPDGEVLAVGQPSNISRQESSNG